ncbi:MAG: glycine zipper 2TM domain-containing protein [Sideroxydans sp.]|nr:glycine zipper 2TM domain-containing protein [Sideroxydans sp.]
MKKSNLLLLALLATLAACSPKPSTEEVAAQVKIALEAEKAQQAAQDKVVEEKVQAALAEEKAKQAAAAPVAAPAPVAAATAAAPVKKAAAPKSAHAPAANEKVNAPMTAMKPVCTNCGVVLSINKIEEAGKGSGLGVIGGGVVGGLLGNQVGGGTGKDLATLAGAIGGAVAGNAIEKNAKKTIHYDIVVRMEDGGERTYRQATEPALANGQKVKIENDSVIAN